MGIAADADHGVLRGDLKRITDGRFEFMPSISRDGRKLAFAGTKRGATTRSPAHNNKPFVFPSEIRVRDLDTGREAAVSGGEPFPFGPEISPDGSMVAYIAERKLYLAQVRNPSPRMVVSSGAGKPWNWSPDNNRLLFGKVEDGHWNIFILDVVTGRQPLFLSSAGYDLYQAKYSPDSRAVAVNACTIDLTACWVFIVPLKPNGVPDKDHWIAIDHPSFWDDKPRWSPNGNLLYFISDRDGHLCLWAQRLDGRTKRPISKPFPLYHFHNSRLAMINVGTGTLEIDVARDKIVMGLGELTGNIWSLRR